MCLKTIGSSSLFRDGPLSLVRYDSFVCCSEVKLLCSNRVSSFLCIMDYAESTFQTRISLFANPSSYNSVLPTKTDLYNKIMQKKKP